MDAISYLNVILISAAVLFNKACFAAPAVKGPRVQDKNPGEWAEFACAVSCSHSIDWYVEGYTGHITETCTETRDGMMVCKETTQPCSSSSSTTRYTETLRVLAKPELASSSIAVQCAAISLSLPTKKECEPFLSYSRYALLTVKSLPTEPPTAPSPSPTPVVCPTTVEEVTTTVHVTDTVFAVKDHTMTQTVTQTVVIEATPTPKPDTVTASGSGSGEPLRP